MTVPGARRRETALAYSGGAIDRASSQRTDPAWVDATPRWFTPAQLTELAVARGRLGREDSIGRYLMHSWLEENR